MMSDETDSIIDKIFPLALMIAHVKAELASQISKRIIKEIEKNQKLSSLEKDAITRATDEIVSQQPPEIFGIDLNWTPKSEEEVREKLRKLKIDKQFKKKLIKAVLNKLKTEQSKLTNNR